jgi:hypothetical protein
MDAAPARPGPEVIGARDHYHCPLACEHPQAVAVGELLLCGLCWLFHDRVTIMVPCTEEICE